MPVRPSLAAAVLLALGGCSDLGFDRPSFAYAPEAPMPRLAMSGVSSVTAIDDRPEGPRRYAALLGGAKTIAVGDAAQPVAAEVANVFADAFEARGLLAPAGQAPFSVKLVLRRFFAEQAGGRTATIDVDLLLLDRAGRVVYEDSARDARRENSAAGKAEPALRRLLQGVLNQTVDRMLGKPGLVWALRNAT